MKHVHFISMLLLVLFIAGCKTVSPEKRKKEAKNRSLVIGNPVSYGISGMLIFPVGCDYNPPVYAGSNEEERGKSKYNVSSNLSLSRVTSGLADRNASVEYANPIEEQFDITNLLFYNQEDETTYPLVEDTIHILSFALHREYKKPLIFYRVVLRDMNGDSFFNSKDPIVLYISDINGKNFVPVTPRDEQFVDYFYFETTNKILVKTMIDSNGDKLFLPGDETNFREMKLDSPAMARDIFNKSLKDALRVY